MFSVVTEFQAPQFPCRGPPPFGNDGRKGNRLRCSPKSIDAGTGQHTALPLHSPLVETRVGHSASAPGCSEKPKGTCKRVYTTLHERPPSTTMCAPVMYLASSDARKTAACATSQASPILPVGHC